MAGTTLGEAVASRWGALSLSTAAMATLVGCESWSAANGWTPWWATGVTGDAVTSKGRRRRFQQWRVAVLVGCRWAARVRVQQLAGVAWRCNGQQMGGIVALYSGEGCTGGLQELECSTWLESHGGAVASKGRRRRFQQRRGPHWWAASVGLCSTWLESHGDAVASKGRRRRVQQWRWPHWWAARVRVQQQIWGPQFSNWG